MATIEAARVVGRDAPQPGAPYGPQSGGQRAADNAANNAPTGASSSRYAMTIDVEDYYQVSAFADTIRREDWPNFTPRVALNSYALLDMLAQTGAKATFFTLGCVAQDNPALVRRIVHEGHEIASHGWAHWRVYEQSRAEFTDDIRRARLLLEDLTGQRVRGYRAPSFSITAQTPWAYEALAEAGYDYSSSLNPIRHDHYGDASAPRGAFFETSAGILEIPVTTLAWRGRRFAAGGGGFFRLLPVGWFRLAANRAHAEGLPVNFYLHPWEIDPGQPRIKGAPFKARLRHRIGLGRCAPKFRAHLEAYDWTRMDAVYGALLAQKGGAA